MQTPALAVASHHTTPPEGGRLRQANDCRGPSGACAIRTRAPLRELRLEHADSLPHGIDVAVRDVVHHDLNRGGARQTDPDARSMSQHRGRADTRRVGRAQAGHAAANLVADLLDPVGELDGGHGLGKRTRVGRHVRNQERLGIAAERVLDGARTLAWDDGTERAMNERQAPRASMMDTPRNRRVRAGGT